MNYRLAMMGLSWQLFTAESEAESSKVLCCLNLQIKLERLFAVILEEDFYYHFQK
tara:strand:- start:56 stop:220 length:165 start_codon:yes stop_codon:yes gene_type:complete